MATNSVNLDALVPRDDFELEAESIGGNPRSNIAISDLDSGFFSSALRKPDFQRETTYWNPEKVADLVKAFIDGDLIPAVILWQRGSEIFVIDGAHRLGALIAWVKNDYGDYRTSLEFFGGRVSDEQTRIAEKTRVLIKKTVGSYAELQAASNNMGNISDEMKKKVAGLAANSIVVQWVTATDSSAAEASFFKINQAAQPIDPTERRLLQSRTAANAIAARCIARGGSGYQYWKNFSDDKQKQIVTLGQQIFDALYKPQLTEGPIRTLDIPVAGHGYNALPFIFDLVNQSNGLPLPETMGSRKLGVALPPDENGSKTVEYLKKVKSVVDSLTGNKPKSLGFHPAVYFYGQRGQFQPNSFLAAAEFIRHLNERKLLTQFTKVRANFEDYILKNSVFVSLTISRLGSGARSLNRVRDLYIKVFESLRDGKDTEAISNSLYDDPEYAHLSAARVPSPRAGLQHGASGRVSTATKSAVFFRDAIAGAPKCAICGAAVHANSMSFDHIIRRRDGGTGDMANTQITHFYCNTGVKS
ncbi:MAG: DUF262 domain-containing protein [Proteobacteria bacterium]|nr:DUF262 domain-containing protein [Pseudomonadota bacterium]